MARKVNTKFVIALSVTLCSVSGVFAAIKVRSMLRNRNPEVFKALAAEAEKAGNHLDAASNYSRAAELMRNHHDAGADEFFSRSAELYMMVSKNAQTQDEALQAYGKAKDARVQALIENPHNKEVNAALLEDDYLDARSNPPLASWRDVEDVATKLIKNSDSLKPRLYRGEARLIKVLAIATNDKPATPDAFAGVDEDVAAALKMDPNSGAAVALAASVMQNKAFQGELRRGPRNNLDFLDTKEVKDPKNSKPTKDTFRDEIDATEKYLRDYLAKNPGQPDAAFQLAGLLRQRYVLITGAKNATGAAAPGPKAAPWHDPNTDLKDSISFAEQAVANSTEDIIDNGFAGFLANEYLLAKQPENAEKVFSNLIARAPDEPIGYFALADLYVHLGDVSKAIDSFKDVVRRPKIGIGREAKRNDLIQSKSREMIVWLNMDLVEQGAAPEQNAARMKEAADYTDLLRTSHTPRGVIDLLDGRAQLINRAYPQAVASLRRAETNLSNNRELLEDYRRAEMQLMRINQLQGQLGGALDALEKILVVNPDDPEVILQKSSILVQLGRYEDTRVLLEHYLGSYDVTTQSFPNRDHLAPGFFERASGIWKIANNAKNIVAGTRPDDTTDHDSTFYLQLALSEINAEDYESAAADAGRVLEKEATNSDAYNQQAYQTAIVANIELKQLEPAKILAARALAKYPANTGFQVLKARLEITGAATTPESRRKLVDAISDKFIQQMSYASISREEKDSDGEIAALQKAEEMVKAASTPDERDRLAAVIDRIFSAAITAASAAKGTPKQEAYYALAQTCVTKAEKLNQDGTGGLLYRGRLEFVKSDGKNGLDFLRQAVASHPDYAVAHFILGEVYLAIALKNDPSGMGGGAAGTNRNLALEQFREVLRLAPNHIQAIQFAINLLIDSGDTTNIKEAQQLVETGLRLSPNNPYFMTASEFLTGNPQDAITRREKILEKNPEDNSTEAIDNRRRLAMLYLRQKDELGTPQSVKASDMARAVQLVEWAYSKNKDKLWLANLLASYYVEVARTAQPHQTDPKDPLQIAVARSLNVYDDFTAGKSDLVQTAAGMGLAIYENFMAGKDDTVRFNTLLLKSEFLHGLVITQAAYNALAEDGKISPGAKAAYDAYIEAMTAKANGKAYNDKAVEEGPKDEAVRILKLAQTLEPADSGEAERRLGDLYFDMSQMPEAQAVYAKVLDKEKEKDPSMRLRVLRRFIEVELRLDIPENVADRVQFADAVKRLDDAIKSDPRDVQALILRAYACVRENSVEKDPQKKRQLVAASLGFLNQALAIDPANSDALYYRAQAFVASGGEHLPDAIRDLVLSIKGDHTSVKGQMLLATVYRRSHRYEEAVVEYIEVLDKFPELLPARVDYADFLMSLAQQLHTFPPESSEDFVVSIRRLDPEGKLYELAKKSSELYPGQAKWPLMYAQLLEMQDKNDVALRIFEALYKSKASHEAPIIDAYLEILCKTKNYPAVVEVTTKILSLSNLAPFLEDHPEWSVLYVRRAAAYRSLGKQKEAAEDLNAALAVVAGAAKEQKYEPFANLLMKSVGILSDLDDAQAPAAERLIADQLQARLAANPSETISQVGLMQMLLLLRQPDEALKVAQSTTVPVDDPKLKLMVLRQMAMVKYQAHEYAESEKDFNALLALTPKDIESLNNYAFMLADSMNQAPKAIEVANKALEVLNTESNENEVTAAYSDIYDTLGWAQLRAGDAKSAAASLQHSVQTQPTSDAYYHLAKAYQMIGDINAAKTACTAGILLATKRKDAVLTDLMDLQVKLNK